MRDNYFGVMIDCSRNAVMKIDEIKKYAFILSKFGYNMIQLYTEDTYQIDGEPYFGYMRGKYTKEELKDLDNYCESIGIELIPCIQTLAHLNQMFKWNTYRQTVLDIDDILLTDNEKTYELIDKMFKSASECFKSKRINIGMDEAHNLGLGKHLDLYGYEGRFDILLRHLNKVVDIASKYGFKPMMWSDMFFRTANHGNYFGYDVTIPKEIKELVPKNLDLIYWDYYKTKKSDYLGMIKAHESFENDYWFAGGAWTWSGFAPMNNFSMIGMKQAMLACKERKTKNIFLTMWKDDGGECSFYSCLPSLYFIKKIYEGETNMKVIKEGFERITGESFDHMKSLDLPNQICKNKDNNMNPSKYMFYSDVLSGFLDFHTVEGGEKDYKKFAKILNKYAKESKNYAYVFEYMSNLCDCLSIKYNLGLRTRAAYKENDKEKLVEVVKDIPKLIKKIEKFYVSFRALWYKENKPEGFEVQDQRIGGLIQRLKSISLRIQSYLNGEIDSIKELEEELLDTLPGWNRTFTLYNSWKENVSVNKI